MVLHDVGRWFPAERLERVDHTSLAVAAFGSDSTDVACDVEREFFPVQLGEEVEELSGLSLAATIVDQ